MGDSIRVDESTHNSEIPSIRLGDHLGDTELYAESLKLCTQTDALHTMQVEYFMPRQFMGYGILEGVSQKCKSITIRICLLNSIRHLLNNFFSSPFPFCTVLLSIIQELVR
jgi:hypothetical protein